MVNVKLFGPTEREIGQIYGEGAGDLCALALALKSGLVGAVPEAVTRKTGLNDDSLARVTDSLYRLVDLLQDGGAVTDLRIELLDTLGIKLAKRGRPKKMAVGFDYALELQSMITKDGLGVQKAIDTLAEKAGVSSDYIAQQRAKYKVQVRNERISARIWNMGENVSRIADILAPLMYKLLISKRDDGPFITSIRGLDDVEVFFNLKIDDSIFDKILQKESSFHRLGDLFLKRLFVLSCIDAMRASEGFDVFDNLQIVLASAEVLNTHLGTKIDLEGLKFRE